MNARTVGAVLMALAIMVCGTPTLAAPPRLIDINSASSKELKTLPGIGNAEADRIIAGRPYLSKADLVAAKAIPAGTYLSIKRSIIAKPPKGTKAK